MFTSINVFQNLSFLGMLLGLLVFVIILACANFIAFYLLKTNYSQNLTTDQKKIRGIFGMFLSGIGILFAGLNESAWLALFVFTGLIFWLYSVNAEEN